MPPQSPCDGTVVTNDETRSGASSAAPSMHPSLAAAVDGAFERLDGLRLPTSTASFASGKGGRDAVVTVRYSFGGGGDGGGDVGGPSLDRVVRIPVVRGGGGGDDDDGIESGGKSKDVVRVERVSSTKKQTPDETLKGNTKVDLNIWYADPNDFVDSFYRGDEDNQEDDNGGGDAVGTGSSTSRSFFVGKKKKTNRSGGGRGSSGGGGSTTGLDLILSGRLRVAGDKRHLRLVKATMDAARSRRATLSDSTNNSNNNDGDGDANAIQDDGEGNGVDNNGGGPLNIAPSPRRKKRRGSSLLLRRLSSGLSRGLTGSSSRRRMRSSSIASCASDDVAAADGATDRDGITAVDAARSDTAVVAAATKRNVDGAEEEIDRLRNECSYLSDRCARLEAQNIVASSQRLDMCARGLAALVSACALWLYVTLAWWLCDLVVDWAVVASRPATKVVMPILLRATVKGVCALLPYWHHKRHHGLVHRRHEVFAVAFIVMARIKLVRWRIETFKIDDRETVSNWKKDAWQDGSGNGDDGGSGTTTSTSTPLAPPDRFGEAIDEDAVWEANYEISARFLYASVIRLNGLWVKSAQYLSSRADFVPVSYVRELSRLQDEAPATPWDEIRGVLATARVGDKGTSLLDELRDVEETPLASASIGQVHVAQLRSTGEKVVVKVQHPFARTLLTDDLRSLRIIARIVTILEPEYGFFEILMREWADEAQKELDFVSELANLETARNAALRMVSSPHLPDSSSNDHSQCLLTNPSPSCPRRIPFRVEVPRPHPDLSNRDVLVMSFSEGCRVDDMERIRSWGLPRPAVMDAVAQACAHMMYVADIFNGDPHPGNILLRPGTGETMDERGDSDKEGFTVVLLDWGLAKRLPEEKRIAFCQMTYAAATMDFGLMLDAFKTMGLRMKREDVAEDMEGLRFMLRDMAPRSKTRKRIKAKMKNDMEKMKKRERGERIPMENKSYPGEFFFFVRTNELLHGLGSKLHVEMTYLDVLKPYAEKGLGETYKRHAVNSDLPECSHTDLALDKAVTNAIRKLEKQGSIAGAQVCVVDAAGKTMVNRAMGNMGGLKRSLPMRSDAVILGFSCTKAVAATMAHAMVEDGYLSLDEAICKRVWKSFCPFERAPQEIINAFPEDNVEEKWQWKRSVTLRHILTHSAGFWSALPAKFTIRKLASCEECCAAFEYDPTKPEDTLLPGSRPGESCMYHFMSFGWLVAGSLMGAFAARHGKKKVTFEEVYESVLKPKLSSATLVSGFRPCGGSGSHPMALTVADFDFSRLAQLRREAAAMGERESSDEDGLFEEHDGAQKKMWSEIRDSFRGKEFLFDPRIWNCVDAQNANVPAAGGRFSALGLARFYHDLGTGKIIKKDTLRSCTQEANIESRLQALQGQTIMSSNNSSNDDVSSFGLGYQLIKFESDSSEPEAFGHAGVGGSIGFYHRRSGSSVGIMLNKAGQDQGSAKEIVRVISRHLSW